MRKKRVKILRKQAKAENIDLKEVKKDYMNEGKPEGRPFDQKGYNARLRRKRARNKNNDK